MNEINLVVLGITGGIHQVASVIDEPEIKLTQWSIKECDRKDGRRTRHFIGYDIKGNEGRVSSAIVEFDPARKRARTGSGRVYELVGPSGHHRDADYVWERWMLLQKVKNDVEVTGE
jgi:hypothetical protein